MLTDNQKEIYTRAVFDMAREAGFDRTETTLGSNKLYGVWRRIGDTHEVALSFRETSADPTHPTWRAFLWNAKSGEVLMSYDKLHATDALRSAIQLVELAQGQWPEHPSKG